MGAAASVHHDHSDEEILHHIRASMGRDPARTKRLLREVEAMCSRGEGRTVCVTGANGFLASHIVAQLLERGYTVRGTSRDPDNARKCSHLRELPGAAERLTLVAADLLNDDGSFQRAMEGCEAVIHTASPFFMGGDEEALVTPAFHGTLLVLRTAAATASVKRVVLTSSMASVGYNGGRLGPEHVYSAADWSDEDMLQERGLWYPLSKTVAERAAWKFMEDHDVQFTLSTVCPTLVLGPLLQASVNESSSMLLGHLDGSKSEIPNSTIGCVDVRDAAAAHIVVMEAEAAQGRFLCMESSTPLVEVYEQLRELAPEHELPTTVAEGEPAQPMRVDCSPLRELGWEPRPRQTVLADTVASLREKGYYPRSASRNTEY